VRKVDDVPIRARGVPTDKTDMNATTSSPRITDARLSLPAEIDSVLIARAALTRALRRAGWDGDSSGLVILATSEAMANAVIHGSARRGEVRFALAVDPGVARIHVVDEGRPGTSCPAIPRELPSEESTNGRGLYIMRTVADRCDVHPEGDGTEVVMEFLRAA
jgi:anti-sigma regulatory factor (Ser/Thr protein kinase)